MENEEQRLDISIAAAKFLETFRSRFPNAEALQIFDNCLVEYQADLIAMLISEDFRVTPEADSGSDDHGARKDRNYKSIQLTHVQQVIADAQTYEQHQQALATYLEVRQRLKNSCRILLHDQPSDTGENRP